MKAFPLALAALAVLPQAAFAGRPAASSYNFPSASVSQCHSLKDFVVPAGSGAGKKRLAVRNGTVFEVFWNPIRRHCFFNSKARLGQWQRGVVGSSYRYVFAPGGGELIQEFRVLGGPIRRTYYRTALSHGLSVAGPILESASKQRCLSQANYRATVSFMAADSVPEHLQVRFSQVHRVSWNPNSRQCDFRHVGVIDQVPAMFVTHGRPAYHFENGNLVRRTQVGSGWGAASSIHTQTFVRI